jgi:3-hydroxybutyryl-CoA dehydratase
MDDPRAVSSDGTALPEVTHLITQEEIEQYAEISGDFNPLHVDPEAAAASEFGGIIAHGPIALHAFFRAATEWLGADALAPGSEVKVTYRAPTRPGDHVTCRARELQANDGGAEVEAECVNQDDTVVVSVKAVLTRP